MDDVILNKIDIIERCIKRINEEYKGHEKELEDNYTKQDSRATCKIRFRG